MTGGSLQNWRLVKIDPPLRLRSFVTGLYPDGWSGETSSYTRFSAGEVGRVRIVAKRGGPESVAHLTIRLGPIVIGDDKQPHVGEPTTVVRFDLKGNEEKRLVLPAPGEHFRVETTVTPTFRPLPDTRDLGARITYAYLPPRNAAHK